MTVLVWVWLAGTLVILGQMLAGTVGVAILARKATSLATTEWIDLAEEISDRMSLRREVKLLKSHKSFTPMTWGGLSPVVLLPSDADAWSPERKRCVLTHEFAHIKRGDLKLNTLAALLQIVYWFNPLLLLVQRRLRHLRELCCDATVARLLQEKTSDYRDTILENAHWLLSRPAKHRA